MAQAEGKNEDLSPETHHFIGKTPKGRNPMKAWSKMVRQFPLCIGSGIESPATYKHGNMIFAFTT
jgi:hypothetical protein